MTDERDELNAMVLRVARDMQVKLAAKLTEGYRGWGDLQPHDPEDQLTAEVVSRLIEHVQRAQGDPEQWLDVCNLAAMLYDARLRTGFSPHSRPKP